LNGSAALLMCCLAEYLARKGDWNEALRLWEIAQSHSTLSRNAVMSIVEIHVACALRAIQRGFQLIEEFDKRSDPEETELTLPGNDKAIQRDAAKMFRKTQKFLERVVSKKRQKELGIDI